MPVVKESDIPCSGGVRKALRGASLPSPGALKSLRVIPPSPPFSSPRSLVADTCTVVRGFPGSAVAVNSQLIQAQEETAPPLALGHQVDQTIIWLCKSCTRQWVL